MRNINKGPESAINAAQATALSIHFKIDLQLILKRPWHLRMCSTCSYFSSIPPDTESPSNLFSNFSNKRPITRLASLIPPQDDMKNHITWTISCWCVGAGVQWKSMALIFFLAIRSTFPHSPLAPFSPWLQCNAIDSPTYSPGWAKVPPEVFFFFCSINHVE